MTARSIFLCLVASLAIAAATRCSSPRQEIVMSLDNIALELTKRDLASVVDSWQPSTSPPTDLQGYDIAFIEQPTDVACDSPRYRIFSKPGSDSFWINVTTGISGNSTWYGPARLSEFGKIILANGCD